MVFNNFRMLRFSSKSFLHERSEENEERIQQTIEEAKFVDYHHNNNNNLNGKFGV